MKYIIQKMTRNSSDKTAYVFSAGALVAITGLGGAAMAGASAAGAVAVAVEEVKEVVKANEE
jgi:F0F1-type ATP synthase membrane subunit c/vacuolar-type H+-ATPase subunit K